MNPRWLALSAAARGIGALLVLYAKGGVIAVAGDWRVSLCRSMSIESSQRGNVCRALEAILDAGLIEVTSTTVRLVVHPASTAGPPPLRPQLSARNHSTTTSVANDSLSRSPSLLNSASSSPFSTETITTKNQETTPDAHAREAVVSDRTVFDSRSLESLFSKLRKDHGGGTFRAQRSDYDRAQKAVAWAEDESPTDPASACERSIAKFLTHATGKEGDGWPFWGWANDPGKWLAYKPAPPKELKPPLDFKAAARAAGEASAKERLAALDARFDAMIAVTTDPVEREKLDAEKWEKHNRLDRMLGT